MDEASVNEARHPREEFEAFVRETSSYIYSLSYRLSGTRPDAQDLSQETYLRAWRAWTTFDRDRNPFPWLRQICVHCFVERMRTRKRRAATEPLDDRPELASSDPRPEEILIADEEIRKTQSQCYTIVSSGLTGEQRIVFVLTDIFLLDLNETSVLIGKSLSATKALLHRARARMQSRLGNLCSLALKENPCTCSAFHANSQSSAERREYARSILAERARDQAALADTQARVIALFHNLPLLKEPPDWVREIDRIFK